MQGSRLAALGVSLLCVGLGLACTGGGSDAPADGGDAPADGATDAPEDGTDGVADGGDDDDDRPDRPPEDCRLGMTGVLVGLPGWPPGTNRSSTRDTVKLQRTPAPGARTMARIDPSGTVTRADGRPLCHWFKSGNKPGCLSVFTGKGGYGLPVFDIQPGWAQISAGPGTSVPENPLGCKRRTWVKVDRPLEVVGIETLIAANKNTKTLPNWDGVLYESLGGAPRPSGSVGTVPFRAGKMDRHEGRYWIEATLVDKHCGTKSEGAHGWIPLLDKEGTLQVWFDEECR